MSDVSWGSDHLEPPKQRKIPGWVFGCAGGCMFAIGAAVVALYFGGTKLKGWIEKSADPEVQWPELAQVLPFDERPPGFEIVSWPIPFLDVWKLESPSEDLAAFVATAGDSETAAAILDQWLEDPRQAPFFAIQPGKLEETEAALTVQGRELRGTRLHRKLTDGPGSRRPPVPGEIEPGVPVPPEAPAEPAAPEAPEAPGLPEPHEGLGAGGASIARTQSLRGDALALDVTPEGAKSRVLLWLVHRTPGAPVSDEEAARFLAPFRIGPVR